MKKRISIRAAKELIDKKFNSGFTSEDYKKFYVYFNGSHKPVRLIFFPEFHEQAEPAPRD